MAVEHVEREAVIIPFPGARVVALPEDAGERDCRNCLNARFGALTYCTEIGESIVDERRSAESCEAFVREEPDL